MPIKSSTMIKCNIKHSIREISNAKVTHKYEVQSLIKKFTIFNTTRQDSWPIMLYHISYRSIINTIEN